MLAAPLVDCFLKVYSVSPPLMLWFKDMIKKKSKKSKVKNTECSQRKPHTWTKSNVVKVNLTSSDWPMIWRVTKTYSPFYLRYKGPSCCDNLKKHSCNLLTQQMYYIFRNLSKLLNIRRKILILTKCMQCNGS